MGDDQKWEVMREETKQNFNIILKTMLPLRMQKCWHIIKIGSVETAMVVCSVWVMENILLK